MIFKKSFFSFLLLCLAQVSLVFSKERGSSAPFISGDTFRAHAHHYYDETKEEFDPSQVEAGDVIFVKTDPRYLKAFFTKFHPEIPHPYILVTHNSDRSIPDPFRNYLDSPKLLAWFGQNVKGKPHPKLYPIPIGIANKCWGHGNPDLFNAQLSFSKNEDRPNLCYMNFALWTQPIERKHVWELFVDEPWCFSCKGKATAKYLEELCQSKFVLSPRGNGIDCHRTWEALLMGAIPIVRTSSLDPLYTDLPVLVIKEWEEISEEFLNEQYEIMKQKTYNLDKIYIDYWINFIMSKAS